MQNVLKKTPLSERRRRERIPAVLLFFALVILIMPFTNYLGLSYKYRIAPIMVHRVFASMNISEYIFIFSALLSGIGLLLIKRWGWWLFVGASSVFILRNLVVFAMNPELFERGIHPVGGPIVHTLFMMVALAYFLRRDIFMPYLSIHRSGWRLFKRYGIHTPVKVGESTYETVNISEGGMFVRCSDCHQSVSSSIPVVFNLGGETFSYEAGVATHYPGEGMGIAFRNLSNSDRTALRKKLKEVAKRS